MSIIESSLQADNGCAMPWISAGSMVGAEGQPRQGKDDAAANGVIKPPRLTLKQQRTIRALVDGPVMREDLDRLTGASNSPETVRQLRSKGVDIICVLVMKVNRDGQPCWPGRYSLTPTARQLVRTWGFD
jgi:hypothetical protein